MSKRREALRRGLRTFIEDTSRELADLEGRPLRPSPDSEADAETVVTSDALVDDAERAATDSAPPESAPAPAEVDAPTPAPDLEAASLRHDVPDDQQSPPEPPAAQARTIPAGDAAVVLPPAPAALDQRASTPLDAPPSPEPEGDSNGRVAEPDRHVVEPDGRVAKPEPPAHRRGRPAAPVSSEKPKRLVKTPARRRARQAPVVANGVSPAQAHARKGVCFAYFLNHECWRVAEAYCNSALQVCITRECPIYHLHRDALERRFARKFKHFW